MSLQSEGDLGPYGTGVAVAVANALKHNGTLKTVEMHWSDDLAMASESLQRGSNVFIADIK